MSEKLDTIPDLSERAAHFNHHDPVGMQDPYEFFDALRAKCPIARSEEHGGFYFSASYDVAKAIYSEHKNFTTTEGTALPPQMVTLLPIDLDPPQHTRFRKVLNPFFTAAAASADQPRIEGIVNSLIDAFIETGSAELATQLTRPTLARTMLPIIGVPSHDQEKIASVLDYMVHYRTVDEKGWQEGNAFVATYLTGLAASRRNGVPGNDLLQCLIDQPIDGKFLTDDEIFRVLLLTLFGALDTTHAAISEAIYHLARNPDDKQRLISGEVPWDTAIEEFLRFSSPIQAQRRTVVNAIEIAGQTIPAGTPVLALNGAANRDPAKFPEPGSCMIDRDAREHLAFGAGAHVCIGRNYARMMIKIVLSTLLQRLADFTVAADFKPHYTTAESRGIKVLPVTFTPGPAA
jgi:cytochrome P450